MLIQIWVYSNNLEEKFYFKNHHIITDEQENSIKSALKPLINITKKLNLNLSRVAKSYSISGLNIHLFYYNDLIFILSLYTNEKSYIFKGFIRKINELIEIYRKEENQFSLNSNIHFRNNFVKLLNQVEIDLFAKKSSSFKKESDFLEKNKEGRMSRGKFLVLGLGSSGKSSIIARTIENWTNEEIEKIKPTILQTIHNYSDDVLNETISIYDLGGQVAFRKKHLENEDLYTDIKTIIYIVDLLEPKLDVNFEYFTKIIKKVKEFNQNPIISIFFHKYDPNNRALLFENLESCLSKFLFILNDPSLKNLDISYYITSIFDDSAKDAFLRIIFYSIPVTFLTKTIQNNLVLKAANSLYPILSEIENTTIKSNSELENVLYKNSVVFGYEIAKVTVNQWMEFLLSSKQPETQKLKSNDLFIDINIDSSTNTVTICLKCPLSENLKRYPAVCEITHGLFNGLGNYLGYPNSKLISSEIRDKTDNCKIQLK